MALVTARRILVTPRSLTKAGLETVPELAVLRDAGFELIGSTPGATPSATELTELLPGAEGWLAGVEPITAEVLAHADGLRAISRNGAGIDNIDLAAADARGIRVLRAPGANARGVAELALALGIGALRGLGRSSQALAAGRWQRELGAEVPGTAVGIIGLGAVGRLTAALFAGLDAHVLGHDPFVRDPPAGVTELVPLDELASRCRLITLHCPPLPDGSPLVDARLIDRMPRGTALVNTARSSLVDDAAVLAALESGALSSYSVDAFDTEPPALSPLLAHERVVATPHLGGYTAASVSRAARDAAQNLLDALTATAAAAVR
ncbi:NAD(P)-dependent oxidoreductase [Gryllotalpicola reticulitermitis]|uniref:NAD(P)-dependent oxidoreductase n=1 Tax=Gryllotalpicola reticulitermitis TaxID=1184153 RepID=A0ABV8Q4T9_9MICO